MQILFTPYFLEKYKPDFHAIKKDGWLENLYKGDDEQNKVITFLNKQVADFVQTSVTQNKFPVAIGGDCHKTFGVMKGLNNCGINPALLWLDAHGDFNTFETTPSGFVGGMSLAILTGREEPALLHDLDLNPLPEERVIIYDRRNLDPEEAVQLEKSKVRQPENLKELFNECKKEKEIYIHLDADIINPIDAPAMLYKTSGGPRLSALKEFLKSIKEKTVAVSVTMWEPSLDKDKTTEKAVFELLYIFD
jgi:arginase